MTRSLQKWLAALTLLICATHASAFESWGQHDAFETTTFTTQSGYFSGDMVTFSLASPTKLQVTVSPNNGTYDGGVYNISWGLVELFKRDANAGPDIPVTSFAMGIDQHVLSLSSGSYFFAFSGYSGSGGLGTMGGRYTIESSVLTVPEPGALAMFVVGLFGVAGVAGRRSRHQAVAREEHAAKLSG